MNWEIWQGAESPGDKKGEVMKNLKKKIISIFLVLVMVLTMLPVDMGVDTAEAADTTGSLTLTYRWGTNNLIQMNTNLPSDTPCVNFGAGDNGCSIDQSGNTVQWVGWIGMDNVDGTIVLTFHFNNQFTAGQSYVLPKGAVFGFTDGKTYTLDGDYTFTFDGSAWTMKVEKEPVEFGMTYRGGEASYVQTNTTIPTGLEYDATNSNIIYESTNTVSSLSVIDTGAEQVLSVSYGAACETGDVITIEKGSKFAFSEYNVYVLDRTWKFTFNGTSWTAMAATNVISASGASTYLQPILDASSTENGITLTHNLDEAGGTLASSSIASFNRDSKALVSINFSPAATAGDTYFWQKGSTITVNGVTYYLDTTYKFTFNGSSWTTTEINVVNVEAALKPSGVYGSVIQFGGFYNLEVPADNTKFNFEGTVKLDGIEIIDNVDFWFGGYAGTDTISFNCNKDFVNKLLTVEAGTVLSYNDTYVTITKTFNGIWDGTTWTIVPVIVAERELEQGYTTETLVQFDEFYDLGLSEQGSLLFEGTVFLDGVKVESPEFIGYPNNATICLQNISHQNKVLTIMAGSVISYDGVGVKVSKTFNMMHNGSAWTEVDLIYSDVEGDANGDTNVDSMDLIRLKKVLDKAKEANNQCDLDANQKQNGVDAHYLRLIILYDSISNLDVLDPLLYMGGDDFISFADLPVDATDTSKIAEFKALGFNTSLLTEDDADPDVYNATCVTSDEITVDGNILTLEYNGYTNGKCVQFKTNLTATGQGQEGIYKNFLADPTSGYNIKQSGAQSAGWFQMDDTSGTIVYFVPQFNAYFDNNDQYILEAGSTFTFGGVVYTLDRTYTVTVKNDYLASIQNLDNAGLNVWIRNYSNQAGYFTDYMTNLLALHKDKIDGFYIIDEPFATTDLYNYSKENFSAGEITDSFKNINSDLVPWFNKNYADTYFHINHIPMSSYNHYGTMKDGVLQDKQADPVKYSAFFETYVNDVLSMVTTTDEKKTIGFDYYPLGYTEVEKILWWESTDFVSTGIAPNYLVNMLIPAQKAKEFGTTFSTCIQTFDQTLGNEKREITTAAEVTFQLYTALACGADMFEYFTYNSLEDTVNNVTFNGIIDLNGNKTELYDEVKEANTNAFSFANVINVFDWQGTQVSSGTSTNKNSTGISTAKNSGLGLLLDDSSNGVLSSVSSDDDAVVGYYTKGTQAGYMVANYNDPKQVTTNNTVTLTFADCTKARVYTAVDGKLTSNVVELTNGSYTHEVAPGGGFFIIPVNAQ